MDLFEKIYTLDQVKKIQPGSLILVSLNLSSHRVMTLKKWYQPWNYPEPYSTLLDFTFEEEDEISRLLLLNEIEFISSSLEAVPLEDWAGLIHLLHPKLRTKVQEWLQSKISV